MNKYSELIKKWEMILDKVVLFNGEVYELSISEPATEEELILKEKELGMKIPHSFREVLLSFSKRVNFRWHMPDKVNIPKEFGGIFSAELSWDIEYFENLNELAESIEDDEIEDCGLKDKLQISETGNGDIITLDIEGKVIYWDHETCETTYLAENFMEYLYKMTELYGIGKEIWQYEFCIDENGINIENSGVKRWQEWFESFVFISQKENRKTVYDLIKYVEYTGCVTDDILNEFEQYKKEDVLKIIKTKIDKASEKEKEVFYEITACYLGTFAKEWVEELWEELSEIPETRSYLTIKCLEKAGTEKVIKYVEELFKKEGIRDYIAKEHLAFAEDELVIKWLKQYISEKTNKSEWYYLYAMSKPSWETIEEWINEGGRYKMVALNALEYMSKRNPKRAKIYKIVKPYSKERMVNFLEEAKNKEILESKKTVYNLIIEKLDMITAE